MGNHHLCVTMSIELLFNGLNALFLPCFKICGYKSWGFSVINLMWIPRNVVIVCLSCCEWFEYLEWLVNKNFMPGFLRIPAMKSFFFISSVFVRSTMFSWEVHHCWRCLSNLIGWGLSLFFPFLFFFPIFSLFYILVYVVWMKVWFIHLFNLKIIFLDKFWLI